MTVPPPDRVPAAARARAAIAGAPAKRRATTTTPDMAPGPASGERARTRPGAIVPPKNLCHKPLDWVLTMAVCQPLHPFKERRWPPRRLRQPLDPRLNSSCDSKGWLL